RFSVAKPAGPARSRQAAGPRPRARSPSMRRERQANGERRAFAEPAFDAAPAAVAIEHVLDQGKPEPGAPLGAPLADRDPIEPLAHPGQRRRRAARPATAN